MGKTLLDISMSLDGFISGANISPQQPLGENGMRLHDWFFDARTPADDAIQKELIDSIGAVIVGGRTYKDGIETGWEMKNPFPAPPFVIVHSLPEIRVDGFTYVTDGIESALEKAQATAGDKKVWVMGGANLIQQYIQAGLIDEMQIHIAPILLGNGTPLFANTKLMTLEQTRVIETPAATHLRYRVVK